MKNFCLHFASLLISLFFLSCCGKTDKDVLRLNICSEPDSFFPWECNAADTKAVCWNIFEGLLSFDEFGKLHPGLCESYEFSRDKRTCVFHLRGGIKFHNGAEFSSADCVYTYENLAGLNGKTPVDNILSSIIDGVSAPDSSTFVVRLNKRAGSFLASAVTPILPKDYKDHANLPIGTGPYKFVEYELHKKIVLERNEHYWNSQKDAKIHRIEIYVMDDDNKILDALNSNQLDIAQTTVLGKNHKFSHKYQFYSVPHNYIQIFAMNNSVKPFDNPLVREAISMAVDRNEIIEKVLGGYGTPIYSNSSPLLASYYNDRLSEFYKHDYEAARTLLKSSGYPDGFDLTITVPENYKIHVDTAEVISKQLSKIGIKCKIKKLDWLDWLNQVNEKFDYEATVIAFTGRLDPAQSLIRYLSDYEHNFMRYNNPLFDETFRKAESEPLLTRRINYFKYCQELLTKDAPAVFICDPNNVILMRKDLQGYVFYPTPYYDFSRMYFEE